MTKAVQLAIVILMKFKIEYSKEKNLLLKATRKICFDDVVEAIKNDNILDILEHHNNKKYQRQQILVVKIKNYIYAVPFVINKKKNIRFLKTVYPSRNLTKKYLKKK